MERSLLALDRVTKHFGGLTALMDVSFSVDQGEIMGLIGPNGAGKSTLINVISGIFSPSRGRIFFGDHEITCLKPHQIVKRGLIRTFQASVVYEECSVEENVLRGLHCQRKLRLRDALLSSRAAEKEESNIRREAERILSFTGLSALKGETARNLPYGFQKLLEVAVALGCQPRMLLLDEPSTGLNPKETTNLMRILRILREQGMSILLVAHDVKMVLDLCDRITVLHYGEKLAVGTPSEIKKDVKVIEAYLGTEGEGAVS
jgi:branched-chain amino acid transport system ATP-binding protein